MNVFKFFQIKEQLRILYYQVLYFFFPTYFYNYKSHIPHKWTPNKDFGGFNNKGKQNLKYPKSFEDLAQVFQEANQARIPVNICNTGHSQSGVSLSRGWRVCLNKIGHQISMIDEEHVQVQGICSIGDLTNFLYKNGRHLPVVGTEFSISLGGYLSVGGGGFNSIEYGVLVEFVTKLELLTIEGKTISCSKSENKEIFYAVLGGLGQLGVIKSVTLQTLPKNNKNLLYNYMFQLNDVENVLELLNELTQLPINYCFSGVGTDHSRKIYFYISVGFRMFDKDNPSKLRIKEVEQKIEKVLNGKKLYKIKRIYRNKFNRLIPISPMPDTQYKKWNEYACGISKFPELFHHLIGILQKYPKMGYAIPLYIIKNNKELSNLDCHFFGSQASDDYLIGFGLYNHYEEGWYDKELMDKISDELFELSISQGGVPYLNSKPDFTEKRLHIIYPNYAKFKQLKQKLDPNHLLNNGVFETEKSISKPLKEA